MQKNKRPSSIIWFIIHIFFPLVPFFVEGLIRILVYDCSISWQFFNSATLAMSIGLLCLFVNQNLISHHRVILSQEESTVIVGIAHLFSAMAIISFVFFGVIVLLSALIEKANPQGVNMIKLSCDKVVFIGSIIPLTVSIIAQISFKLRTTI